ncbi:MAG TPA: proteasome subunit beta [Pseudonocardiaceae bacterium]|nr:proteasome subunit beta [Pseudonocardiaceae bacterium]
MENPPSHSPLGTGFGPAYLSMGTSSFTDFLRAQAPDLLPGRKLPVGFPLDGQVGDRLRIPHGTTIVAATFAGGVLIAGDRRATSGNLIAHHEMDKVFVTDEFSAVGVAGTAGIAIEMIRLYAVELRHYEKIEGVSLSLDGKANKLATMVRGNLDGALAGLVALPLFVGYDPEATNPARAGRIVSFDPAGGRYEEHGGYHAIGSGSMFAKSSLKKLHDPDAPVDATVRDVVEALYDASDDDSGTGGPDTVRRIYPTIATITAEDGAVKLPEGRIGEVVDTVLAARTARATS